MHRHYCAVLIVLYDTAAAEKEERFAVFYSQIQTRQKALGARTRFSNFFFTDLQYFSAMCHSFAGRSVGSSFSFVHCLMISVLVGRRLRNVGLGPLRLGKVLGLSLLMFGQMLSIGRYYLYS